MYHSVIRSLLHWRSHHYLRALFFSFLCSLYSTCCPSSNFCFPVGLRVLSLLENATVLFGWRRQDRLCVRSQVRGRVEKVRQWFLSLLLHHSQLNSWCCLCLLQAVCFHSVLFFSLKKEITIHKVSRKHGCCTFTVFEWKHPCSTCHWKDL